MVGKNLRRVGGQSLLAHAITVAQRSELLDRVLVSTDAEDICAEATLLGAEVPFLRPEELSQDGSPEWDAWKHLAGHLIGNGARDSDLIVSVPPTAPLRIPADIDRAVRTFRKGGSDLVLAITESARSPWFNMVTRDAAGHIELASTGRHIPVDRRQDAPPMFDITTVVYVTSLGFVGSASRMFDGKIGAINVPPERAIDIDTELDLAIADFLARKRLG